MQQDQTTQPADAAGAAPADAMTAAASMPEATAPAADSMAAATDIAATGSASNAAAFQQMGFDHLLGQLDWVGWVVLVTLVCMSIVSWIYTVMNAIRNTQITGRMEKLIRTFWETPSAGDAVRFMEEQPKSEPFSKIALDCASAAAHHQRHEGSRLVEALNRWRIRERG